MFITSRERVTCLTIVSSEPNKTYLPHFVLKGTGKRAQSGNNPPEGVFVQWAEKGSYREEHMLEMIKQLPNRASPFSRQTGKGYALFVLDNYSVHLMPSVKKALLKRGYVLIGIGGGITGDVQVCPFII